MLFRSIEPPAFYLTGRNFWSDWGNDEEYRIPVDSSESLGEKLYCYYRIFKSPQARAQGWEYSRGLYIFSR